MGLNVASRTVVVTTDSGTREVSTSVRILRDLLTQLGITRSEFPNIEIDGDMIDDDNYVLPTANFVLMALPNPDGASV
jgi:hypothetical protein